jgi:hypothetical protein
MEKTINIHNYTNINAEGKFNSKHCKPVICLETGDVFTSVADAAIAIGCHAQDISSHLTGKKRAVKGKHFCYLSRATESLDAIVTRLRETSAMEADALKWRAYQAEQEAIRIAEEKRLEEERKAEAKRLEDERKAKEKYEAEVAKAKAKIERRHRMCSRLEQQYNEAFARAMEAEKEYEALTGATYIEGNYEKECEVA